MSKGEVFMPSLPADVIRALQVYGDARADNDGTSGHRLQDAILAMRNFAAGLIDEQRRTIDCLMCGMPDDGTTPVIRRIAALEDDARRYRWLRDKGDAMWAPLANRVKGGAQQVDAAIDAANV